MSRGIVSPVSHALATNPFLASSKTEARQLAGKALGLIDLVDNATREDLLLAEQLCKRAVELDPADGELWAAYSEVTASFIPGRGFDRSPARYETANGLAQRGITLSPQSSYAQFALANYYRMQAGTREEAVRMMDRLLERYPSDKRLLRRRGNVARELGRFEEGLNFQDRAAALPGGDASAVFNRAQILWMMGRPEEGEAALDRSLAIQPLAAARLDKIALLLARGDFEQAQVWLGLLPPSWLLEDRGAYLAGQLWLWSGQPEKALGVWQVVPRDFLEHEYVGAKAFLTGLAHEAAGRPEVAQADWKAALGVIDRRLAAWPTSADLLRWRAHLLARLGRRVEADQVLASFQSPPQPWWLESMTEQSLSAVTEALLGREDKAIRDVEARLQKPFGFVPLNVVALRHDPIWRPLRPSPRFQALLAAGGKTELPSATTVEPRSIAVLAFANMSAEKDTDYFSDGISEEILNAWTGIPRSG